MNLQLISDSSLDYRRVPAFCTRMSHRWLKFYKSKTKLLFPTKKLVPPPFILVSQLSTFPGQTSRNYPLSFPFPLSLQTSFRITTSIYLISFSFLTVLSSLTSLMVSQQAPKCFPWPHSLELLHSASATLSGRLLLCLKHSLFKAL